jgi:hypothetical protein
VRKFWYEVRVLGTGWVRQPGEFKSSLKAQDAAIKNNRRPYRIMYEGKNDPEVPQPNKLVLPPTVGHQP